MSCDVRTNPSSAHAHNTVELAAWRCGWSADFAKRFQADNAVILAENDDGAAVWSSGDWGVSRWFTAACRWRTWRTSGAMESPRSHQSLDEEGNSTRGQTVASSPSNWLATYVTVTNPLAVVYGTPRSISVLGQCRGRGSFFALRYTSLDWSPCRFGGIKRRCLPVMTHKNRAN